MDKQRLYGLVVHSERETHQNRAVGDEARCDVLLRWCDAAPDQGAPLPGRSLLEYSPGRPFYAANALDDGGFALRFHGAADFSIGPGLGEVVGYASARSTPDYAMVLATGAVLAFQLYARNLPVLHASAVDLGGVAVAFTGFAGMGKSTMATVLCAEGGRLITDDILRLDAEGDQLLTRLGATEVRLRKGASTLAERFSGTPGRRTSADQRDVLRLADDATDGVPLGALVVPLPDRDATEVRVEQMTGSQAVMDLLRYPRLLGWTDREYLAMQVQHAATIAQRVPVYRAHIPWGPPFRPALGAELLELLGLGAAVASPQDSRV